jgi:ketosteroid isomerase-like protein
MLKSRNLTSHTYREEVAEEICRQITELYFSLLIRLRGKLESLYSEQDKSVFDKG